jgi:hypothetical protein
VRSGANAGLRVFGSAFAAERAAAVLVADVRSATYSDASRSARWACDPAINSRRRRSNQ